MLAEKSPINTNESNLAEQHDPMKNLREENNKNTELYPEVMENLNSIAKKVGFKELLSHSMFKKYIMTAGLFKDYCFFPPEGLENQKLIQEIDKDFADKGIFSVLGHEKQHFKDPAHRAATKPINYPEEVTMEEEAKIDSQKFIGIENQVNLQTLNDKFTELSEKKEEDNIEDNINDEIKNSIAIENVYTDFIYKGIDTLKQESTEDRYLKVYKFIKEDIIKAIVREENRIKKELLEKYNKILE